MGQINKTRYGIFTVTLKTIAAESDSYTVEISYRSNDEPILAWARVFRTDKVSYDRGIAVTLADYIIAIKTGVVPDHGYTPASFKDMRTWVRELSKDTDFCIAFNSSPVITQAVFHHDQEYEVKGKTLVRNRVTEYCIATSLIGPDNHINAIYRVTFAGAHTDETERNGYRAVGVNRNVTFTVTNEENIFNINDFVNSYEDKIAGALGL
ncbi:hypothetical protein pEaSNUABM37_00121 [Erwinia phage pEa_SNUABM_37]|nr:hypothetical protein pEaSNUABM37_00121 [Erwinia phage pEa_SNUABM_37]QXO10591.1 hypothetical protein pEaSNUABM48_00121 [Erwinia phage pEa_SNUABM_48]